MRDIVTWSIVAFFVLYFIGKFAKAKVKRIVNDLAVNLANVDDEVEPELPAPKPRARAKPAATRTRKRTATK